MYSYDNIYQITDVNYPAGFSYLATDTTFNYDAAGNRTSVIDGSGTTPYTTNNLNQYTAADGTSFTYDDSGNMTNDDRYTYNYDPENRLLKVTKDSPGQPPAGMALARAVDSLLVYTTGGSNNWSVAGSGHADGDCARSGSAGDDEQSWLQTTVSGPGTLSFWWKVSSEGDCDHLECWVDGVRRDLTSGEEDWAQKTYTITGAGTHTIQWRYQKDGSSSEGSDCGWVDEVQWSGPLSEDPSADDWGSYVYNAGLTYTYDASGRRIEKKYDGITVLKYVYDGDSCIAEYDSSGNLRRKYIYGPGIDQPVCMIESTQTYAGTYYYHFDALGSVVALTNSSGNTVEVYDYSVYGQVGASDASHPNRFMFTGREFDKETGLYYYRARYYKPEIGRFLQVDPMGYEAGMNLYRYCRNNPWNMSDPLGNEPCGPCEPCAPRGRYVYPMDEQDAADPCGCLQTLKKRLDALQIDATNCLTDYPGSVVAKNTAACIAACFWAAAMGGKEGYAVCIAGCGGLAGVIDLGVVSACKQAVQVNVDNAYEHYNFCMCKFNKDGSTGVCAKKYISDPCYSGWAHWFSSGWASWIDWLD